MITNRRLAGIQYVGAAGVSESCARAVQRLLQYNDHITSAKLVTSDHEHALLLTVGESEYVAVKAGFTSGYSGEGPRALARVLALLLGHNIEVEEVHVGVEVLGRLNQSALTERDLQKILGTAPVQPTKVYEYIYEASECVGRNPENYWNHFPPIIPFSLVDSRLADLALSFWDAPGDALLKGFRRLEDIIRSRIHSDENGAKLFAQAFQGSTPPLVWKSTQPSEVIGRSNLFTGAYMAHRNPRAHKELQDEVLPLLSEFLLLNHLFLLESRAVNRPELSTAAVDQSQS